jgi:hypothetical protein
MANARDFFPIEKGWNRFYRQKRQDFSSLPMAYRRFGGCCFAYRSAADGAKATGSAFLAAPTTLAQAEWQTSRLA